MRKIQIVAALAFGVALFAGAQLARAQESYTVQATVSFPFMVGEALMPAGTYQVVPVERDPGLFEIRSESGDGSAFAMATSSESTARRGDCQFQFVKVDGKFYLSQIDDGAGDVSHLVMPDAVVRALHTEAHAPAPVH